MFWSRSACLSNSSVSSEEESLAVHLVNPLLRFLSTSRGRASVVLKWDTFLCCIGRHFFAFSSTPAEQITEPRTKGKKLINFFSSLQCGRKCIAISSPPLASAGLFSSSLHLPPPPTANVIKKLLFPRIVGVAYCDGMHFSFA